MNRLLQNRLLLQLLFALAAAVSLGVLSALFISEAIGSAERVVVGETNRTLQSATTEMSQQFRYWTSNDPSWSSLPAEAQDVSLRALSGTVLRSYPGVEGGFYSNSQLLGYAYPTHDTGAAKLDVPAAEKGIILALVKKSSAARQTVSTVIRGKVDLLVLTAASQDHGNTVAWVMKRLPGRASSGADHRKWLLAILLLASLTAVAGTLATGLSLARGVAEIKSGLAALEKDFEHLLPERTNELGVISRSINRMAAVRRRLESELRREDRLRALGRLSAGLAHEIRNPLNSIRLAVQLMEHRLKNGTLRSKDLKTINAEVDRLGTLLTDLLDLQRTREPNPKWQAIAPVVQHCISVVSSQAALQDTRIELIASDSHLQACFDEPSFTQALVNLLLNALEASPARGVITVRICGEQERAWVEVQDEGPGLQQDAPERLFEPFYTTKPKGTGLGLAVSRELMRNQGGDICFEPQSEGALFTIQLTRTNDAECNRAGS